MKNKLKPAYLCYVTDDYDIYVYEYYSDWTVDIQGDIAFTRPYGIESYGISQEEVDNVVEFHKGRKRHGKRK